MTTTVPVTQKTIPLRISRTLYDDLHSISNKEKKKAYPVDYSIPNQETYEALKEVKEKGHLLKKYKDVRQLFKDIDDEQL